MTAPLGIGRYEVKNRIGHGGMGTLYLAHDPKIARLVVIKVLKTDLEQDEFRTRFDREARAIGALNHPNIVVIYDYGEFEGSPFIVMEYIRGVTLREMIERRTPMQLVDRLRLLEQLCAGLSYAHHVGILHRDIKPANLMVDQHGALKILDFGIARLAEAGQTRATSGPVGTPGYMSPEQIRAQPLDSRSDVFAVGAVAYELVCGREAFPGASYHTILHRVLNEPPSTPSSVAPGVDLELEAVILQALEKEPSRRFQDASALMRAFERVRTRLERPGAGEAPDLDALAPTLAIPRPTPVSRPRITPTPAVEDRAAWVQRYLDEAQRALDEGNYLAADAALRKVEEFNVSDERLQVLRDELEDDSAKTVQRLLENARNHVSRKEFTQAEGLLREVRKIDPRSEEAPRLEAEVKAAREQRDRELATRSGGAQETRPTPAPPAPQAAATIEPPTATVPAVPPAPTPPVIPPTPAVPVAKAAPATKPDKKPVKKTPLAAGLNFPPQYRKAAGIAAAIVAVTGLGLFLRTSGPASVTIAMLDITGGKVLVSQKQCGSSDAPCSFPEGQDLVLTATADSGFVFESFTGRCAGVANGGHLRMPGDGPVNCSATFTNQADAASNQANGLFEAGDYVGAVAVIADNAQKFSSDKRFPDLLTKLYDRVRNDLKDAKDSVKSRTDPKYGQAGDKAKEGEQLADAHQDADAVKALVEATGLYRDLANAAPATPAPVTGPKPSTLNFTVSVGGVVQVGPKPEICSPGSQKCAVNVHIGDNVQLRAKPDTGYAFGGFVGDCKVPDGGTLLVSSPSLTCTASFTHVQYHLTVNVSGSGSVNVGSDKCTSSKSCSVPFYYGDNVALSTTDAADSRVPSFGGVCASRTFTMPAQNAECTVTFAAAVVAPPAKATGTPRSFPLPDGGSVLTLWVQGAGPNDKGFYFDQALVSKERFQQFVMKKSEFRKGVSSPALWDKSYLNDWKDATTPRGSLADPVTWVSYEAARGYCEYVGARLVMDKEWDRAIHINGVADTKLSEWIAEKAANKTTAMSDKTGTSDFQLTETRDKLLPQKTQKDLGFRCARDESPGK